MAVPPPKVVNIPVDNPNNRVGFRGRGMPMRGVPPRGRVGPPGFMGRGGLMMRGPMMPRGGPPGRGALRLLAPRGFVPCCRGGMPVRGRVDMGPVRVDTRPYMFRGRGGHGGPPGRGGPPGNMPRGFGGPPRPVGPPRGPPGAGPPPRGAMARPPRSVPPPQPPQPVPPTAVPPERFPPPATAGAPPPKRGPPPPAAGVPQGPGPAGLVKRPKYETPGYSNGYPAPQSSYTNPAPMDTYAAQGGGVYGGAATYGAAAQHPVSYNSYPQTTDNTGTYQAPAGAHPTHPSSYSTQPGYDSTPEYAHSAYPTGATDDRYSNMYPGQEYSTYQKPASAETYNYGYNYNYTPPQGGYDERAYSGAGAAAGACDTSQVYGSNPATYAVKPEYVYYQ